MMVWIQHHHRSSSSSSSSQQLPHTHITQQQARHITEPPQYLYRPIAIYHLYCLPVLYCLYRL